MYLDNDDIEVMEEEEKPILSSAKILPFVIRKMEETQVYENEFVRPEKPVSNFAQINAEYGEYFMGCE